MTTPASDDRSKFDLTEPPTYAVLMDDDLIGAQPHCPEDGVVMRDIPGGWECPHCGHVQLWEDVEPPAEFDGPSINGG